MKYVGLVDCNNFFVSCERVFRPDLWKKPVVVLSSNDGAIVARSNEVKELGVPMGVPHFKVRDVLEANQVAVFSSNYELYRDMSKRVLDTLEAELGKIRPYSIDEAFFEMEVTDAEAARASLLRLKQLVQRHLGIPVSFGMAPTMTIAKYASELEKRGSGICLLTKEDWLAQTKSVPLGELWGVGAATAKKMREHFLVTVADFLAADNSRIEKIFGVHGTRLRAELNCVGAKAVFEPDDLPKSIMSTRSFAKTITLLSDLEEALAYHISYAAEELRGHNAVAGKLNIMMLTNRHSDWVLRGGTKECLLSQATSDTTVLLKEAKKLAKQLYEPDVPYKKAGVVLGNIKPADSQQPDLFENSSINNNRLMQAMDILNSKLGIGSVTIGRINKKAKWDSKHEFRSPRYTSAWSELPTIK